MEQCLILSARRYDFTDDEKVRHEGVTITYLTGEVQADDTTRGVVPMSVSLPLTLWPSVQQLPGFYEMDFRQRPGKNGRPTLTLTGVRFLQPFSFNGSSPSVPPER